MPPTIRPIRALVCALVLAASLLAPAARAQPPFPDGTRFYGLDREGKTIGYVAVLPAEATERDGRQATVAKCVLHVDTAALGQPIVMSGSAASVVDTATGALISYSWEFTRGETTRKLGCQVADGKATITRSSGAGDPTTTTVDVGPDTYVLGDNDLAGLELMAAHYQLAPGETQDIKVVGPDTETPAPLKGLESAKRTIQGAEREVRRLGMGDLVVLCLDPETNVLLRVETVSGDVLIEISDASVVERAKADAGADILTTHFVPADVQFTDFTKVTRLVAEVEFEGNALLGGSIVPESPMQKFDGTVGDKSLSGKVTIESVPYAGENAEPFPFTGDVPAEFGPYLKPGPFIESDDADIVAKAKEITDGSTDAWQATKKIGTWVAENIDGAIVGDTPSAKRTLENMKGDCGPHAMLAIAMLRAVGIPAKLIVGLTYAPQYGGSFGQHAWVEAYMGGQWRPLDPTTGEVDSLSAVHIKVYEGLGEVLPKKLHIVEHEGGGAARQGRYATDRPIPWELGREYTWVYRQGDKQIGTDVVKFEKGQGEVAYVATSTLKLGEGPGAVEKVLTVALDAELRALTWRSETTAGGQKTVVDIAFSPGKAHARIERPGAEPVERDANVPDEFMVVENNSVLPIAIAAARLQCPVGEMVSYPFFQVETMMMLGLSFGDAGKTVTRSVDGRDVACGTLSFPLAGCELIISDEGLYVGQEGPGNIRIDLE